MRTGRSWTVCWSQHPGGVCLVLGGGGVCLVPGDGLPGPGGSGVWLVPGGGGLLGPGGSGVWLVPGGVVCQVPGGMSAWSQGGWHSSMHWGRHPPPCGQTHTCKNITLATTSLRPVTNVGNSSDCNTDPACDGTMTVPNDQHTKCGKEFALQFNKILKWRL